MSGPPARRLPGRCPYCGSRTPTLACRAHRDLPGLDPHHIALHEPAGSPERAARLAA